MSDALEVRLSATASYESSGRRLDQVAAELFPQYSRSRLQSWIRSGQLLVNGEVKAAKFKLQGGESLEIQAELEAEGDWKPEPIELDIIYEDRHIAVINKPAGLVVHPAAGNRDGTLLNALLHRYPEVETVPRAGIVHRLDKDTTGLMVVARTLEAQTELVRQLQARSVSREYEAVVVGGMTGGGIVDAPIGRHPVNRKKMAVTSDGKSGGKEARTHYSIIQRFDGHTHVRCKLETGRTHQIRVHMAHIHHPLVGDLHHPLARVPPMPVGSGFWLQLDANIPCRTTSRKRATATPR